MQISLRDRFTGSILGVALGDAYGAPYEGGPLERLLWRSLGLFKPGTIRYTDDASMTLTLIRSLIEDQGVHQDMLALRWAAAARWSRGYGPSALRTLKRIRRGADWRQANIHDYKDGSFGNGAAMRVAPIGLLFHHALERCDEAAEQTAVITHAHPLAIEGAKLIARATAHASDNTPPVAIVDALQSAASAEPYIERLAIARQMLDEPVDLPAVRQQLGRSIVAAESVVTAIWLACSHMESTFEQLLQTAHAIGGDVDTIAAMAGGIWGARRGRASLSSNLLERLEDCEAFEHAAENLVALHLQFLESD